ncbi:MAG TPA: NADH-quinone oxidoreductase subunit J [Cytophagaceae bacterium]|jgi:NADH-quinone oxidoreductase subunit J|nr:NADH-quinone oxidoreductase subunit J [Cytophagaceae bacterium]
MEQLLFIVLSLISIAAALCVIFVRNPIYSVLSLVITFFSIAGHYILLKAQFLAIVNIIVYAGAIMVLFLFVIMLLNLNHTENAEKRSFLSKAIAVVAGGILLVSLVGLLKGSTLTPAENGVSSDEIGTVQMLGKVLFTDFVLPFEISSVLFLSAIIGAVMLGKKDLKDH